MTCIVFQLFVMQWGPSSWAGCRHALPQWRHSVHRACLCLCSGACGEASCLLEHSDHHWHGWPGTSSTTCSCHILHPDVEYIFHFCHCVQRVRTADLYFILVWTFWVVRLQQQSYDFISKDVITVGSTVYLVDVLRYKNGKDSTVETKPLFLQMYSWTVANIQCVLSLYDYTRW